MVIALSLINCSNIEEINKWIDSVPNLYMTSPIQSTNLESIETIKKQLFDTFQESLISTEAIKKINSTDKKEAMCYFLHKKLKDLNLPLEEEIRLEEIGLSQGLPTLYKEIEKICVEKFGIEKGSKIAKKIINYSTTDFENFNSSTYEQFKALNEQIKKNIQKCNLAGGDYQLIISTLTYENTVNNLGNGTFEYNFEISSMAQGLADKLGSSYRLRSIISRITADEMFKRGFTKSDKETVIQILRDSLKEALLAFNSHIKNDGKNRTFELFNELVEIQKADRNYKLVWEDRFGITLEDLITQVIAPNMGLIKELKEKNVEFMYNETLLQESHEKREKVMETMIKLQKIAPCLITIFGDQDHTFGSDYTEENIEQLKAVAEFDKKMAQMIFGQDKNGRDIKVKIECSERDLYLSQRETIDLEQRGMTKEQILKYKQAKMNIHGEIFRGVPFRRECEWTVVNNLSGDFYEQDMDTKRDAYIGKYTRISAMARRDNSQRVNSDLAKFNDWKQKRSDLKKQERTPEQEKPKQQEPFDRRSQREIEIAKQIKEKNQAIKRLKEQEMQKDKPKIKTLTNPNQNNIEPNNNGYVNIVILSLIVSFVCGSLSMIVYLFLKGTIK